MKNLSFIIIGIVLFSTLAFKQEDTHLDSVCVPVIKNTSNSAVEYKQDSININDALLLVLSGQITQTIKFLEDSIDLLTEEQEHFRKQLVARFISKKEEYDQLDGLVGEIYSIYRKYWIKVLTTNCSIVEEKSILYEKLKKIDCVKSDDFGEFTEDEYDKLSEFLMSELEKEDIHSIVGTVSPYGDFIAWKTETDSVFEVILPDETTKVKVIFMDDHICFGWLGFATMDKLVAGGWPEDDVLYAIGSRYDVTTEKFTVSYLSHETRHLLDLKKYPNIEEPELEYRAKLTELVLGQKDIRIQVSNFDTMAKKGRASSHAHSSYHIITRIKKLAEEDQGIKITSIDFVSDESIRKYALILLNDSDQIMSQIDPKEVTQFLD